MRAAIAAQPEWVGAVPERVGDRRLPLEGRVVYTGCGTSFHAAQTGGDAIQALEAVLDPPRADAARLRSAHEGETAAHARGGPRLRRARSGSSPARPRARSPSSRTRSSSSRPRSRSRGATRRATRARSPRSRCCADEDVERACREAVQARDRAIALPVSEHDALARRRRRPRLADGAGGGAEAPRGRVGRRRGAPDRAAPPRAPRRGRRDRPLLRPRGRGPGGRARAPGGRGARGDRLRRPTLVPDGASGRGHRPLPDAHARRSPTRRASTRTGSTATTSAGSAPPPRTRARPARAATARRGRGRPRRTCCSGRSRCGRRRRPGRGAA